jgi:hypothetical protein
MSIPKRQRDLQRLCGPGWSISVTGGNHVMLKHDNGTVIYTGQTPSDRRAVRNLRASLRRVSRTGKEE